MSELVPERPALQLVFLIIAAEAVAKLFHRYSEEGQSKEFVRRFFTEFLDTRQIARLEWAFQRTSDFEHLTAREAIDLLYKLRCDVVHEGRYFEFQFKDKPHGMDVLTVRKEQPVIARISIEEIREMILCGAVLACERLTKEAGR